MSLQIEEEVLSPSFCYLGVDVGTQGTKVVAYCPRERIVVTRASVSYHILPSNVPGRAEQDPSIWLDAVEQCFEQIGKSIKKTSYKIAGIGVSGQQHGMVALSSDKIPLRPAKLWCDVEAKEETEYLKSQSSSEIDLSFLTAGFTSPKILWMKRNEPDLFKKTRWFALPHDYITMKLADNLMEPITDAGDASGNGMMNTTNRCNSKSLADIIDPTLFNKLPKIIPNPNFVVGYLNQYYLAKLGLDDETGNKIPISLGSGDNMCSALGVGCVSPGQAVLSLGTSGTVFGVSDTPVPTNTPLAPFCDATGKHLPLACTMSCTGVLTQVLKEWTPNSWNHEIASREASKVDVGCHGITFLPYLGGERTPNWPDAKGSLHGLTASNMKHITNNPALLYRACMEGITFLLADIVLKYFSTEEEELKTLLVVGGGAKNLFWCQMIADIINCKLIFPIETESAALGAAFQAGAAATGEDIVNYVTQQNVRMKPDVVYPQNHQAYREAFQRYKALGTALYSARN